MGAPSRILLLVSMAIMLFVEGWSLVPALRAAPSWRVGTGGRSVMAETESFSSLQRRAGLRALCMYSAVVPPDTTQDDVASASTSTSASAAAAATGTKTPMTAREARTAPARARAHTEASRQKISQANKGKVPWNVGQSHSEATKRKIAEKTREAMARRKVALAAAMDPPMSVEEYGAHKAAAKKAKVTSFLFSPVYLYFRQNRPSLYTLIYNPNTPTPSTTYSTTPLHSPPPGSVPPYGGAHTRRPQAHFRQSEAAVERPRIQGSLQCR